MDGTLPGLPPIPGGAPAPAYPGAGGMAGAARPMMAPNPVGRPSADPEVQEQRVVRSQEKKRLESVLPKKAVDSKILCTRMRGGKIIPGAKPTLIVLTSEIEKARIDSGDPDNFQTEEYIGERLMAKEAPDGFYQCRVVDRNNRPIPEYSPWELEIGDAAADDEIVDDEVEEVDATPPGYTQGGFHGAPFNGALPPGYAAPPPAAPPIDLQSFATSLRGERQDEAKRQGETMSLIAMLMQTQQQQALAMQQEQRQRDEQARRESMEREERYRREAIEREERAEKRRGEFRTTLLAAAPILLPVVEKLFGLNKKDGPDATTLMLMEMVKQKAPDSDIMKSMAGVMAEMTKQQMQLQGAGATAAVEMQAKASEMVFGNLMKTMKEVIDNRPVVGEKESAFEQLAKLAGPILASIQQQHAQQPAATPVAAAPAVMQPQPANLEAPAAAERPQKRPAPRPARRDRNDPSTWPDNHRLAIVIDTLRKLSIGEIPADQRWGVIEFVRQWIPPTVLQSVLTDNKEAVLTATVPVVMEHPPLMAWAQDEENQKFVEDAMTDLKALATNQVTAEYRQSAIRATATFVARRAAPVAKAAPAAPVEAAPVEAKPVEAAPVVDTGDAPPATVVPTPPIAFPAANQSLGRRSAGKRPPPAATGHTSDASPAPEG